MLNDNWEQSDVSDQTAENTTEEKPTEEKSSKARQLLESRSSRST